MVIAGKLNVAVLMRFSVPWLVRLEPSDSNPQDAFGVVVGDLVAVGLAQRCPHQPVDGLLRRLVGVVHGEHDGVGADLEKGL